MEYRSMTEMFLDRVRKYNETVAYSYKKEGQWHFVTWAEFGRFTRNLALSFVELGLGKGDKVCVLANTRPEWDLSDKAILMFGGVTVGIYQTIPPSQVQYVAAHSEAKAIVIEDRVQFEKIKEIIDRCPELKHLIVIDPEGCDGLEFQKYSDLIADSTEREARFGTNLDEMIKGVGQEDLATLIYTSGTTGPPKGAMISHFNLLCEARMLAESTKLSHETDSTLTWLPFSHIFQRAATAGAMWAGIQSHYAEGIDKLLDNLAQTRPTIFYSVPRIFEKAYSKILERANSGGGLKKNLFYWSIAIGRAVSKHRQQGENIPLGLKLQFAIAQKLVFGKIKELFGGNIRFIASSGAPIAREILEFFHAADIVSLEAYGATETTAAITINTPELYRFGTVGWVPPGMEIRIAQDGEIQVKGDMVFKGYFKDEALTAEAFKDDDWYCTGDVGEMDDDGFLKITDRKKDIIVTSGGKNVAPQNIENMLKQSTYISQAMVHGDKRKYLTSLITLDPETMEPWANELGIDGAKWEALCKHPKVTALIQKEIDNVNRSLAKFETIKYFRIVPRDFTIESGELTPTLKLKRKVVTANYVDLLDQMYET